MGRSPNEALDVADPAMAPRRLVRTARSQVEEVWLKIGEDDGGFRLERAAVNEIHDLLIHVHSPVRVDEAKVGVFIVGSEGHMREGTKELISGARNVEVLGVAVNCEEAIQLAVRLLPDVVLIDPGPTGEADLETVRIIKRALPKANVMLLTAQVDIDFLIAGLAAGAVGYILKGTKRSDLLFAIQAAAGGAAVIDGAMLPGLVRRINVKHLTPKVRAGDGGGRTSKNERDTLTKREQEVLDLIADGLTNKAISERLCVTTDTVKSHVHRIIQKLQVSDRTNAAVQALRQEVRR